LKRILLFVPVLFYTFSSPSWAEERPEPCAIQEKASRDAIGKPEYEEAEKTWRTCFALAVEQKKSEYVATRDIWAASLDKLPIGGWVFLMVGQDGTHAVFASHRHATREGNVVSIWLRHEYRESQETIAREHYKSAVERAMYDCARVNSKSVSSTYYAENNLSGLGPTYTYDEAKVGWTPAIPGTVGDSLLDWACKTTPRPQAKPQ
jgi:hypothetical protein